MIESFREGETPVDRFLNYINECELSVDEVAETLKKIEVLIARILEEGAEWDPDFLAKMRQQLQQLLDTLGLSNPADIAIVYDFLSDEFQKRIKPDWYPQKQEFEDLTHNLLTNTSSSPKEITKDSNVLASDVVKYAIINDPNLRGRGGIPLWEYIYNLGMFMLNSYAYSVTFDETDSIQVTQEWLVTNGRHRALTLKVIGANRVKELGMDGWVVVEIESV